MSVRRTTHGSTAVSSWDEVVSASCTARSGFARIGGGDVHWVEFEPDLEPRPGRDEHPPMLLVHGFWCSHVDWLATGPVWARDRRVIALDLRGFGLSEDVPDAHVSTNVDMVIDFITQEFGGGPVVLVGQSMGGMISAFVAARRPDLVASVALVDPVMPIRRSLPNPLSGAFFAAAAAPGLGWLVLEVHRRLSADRREQVLTFASQVARPLRAASPQRQVRVEITRRRDGVRTTRASVQQAARSILGHALFRTGELRAAYDALTVPVLLVHGRRDHLVAARLAEINAARHPEWRFVPLDGIGHMPQWECAEALAEIVQSWLDDGAEDGDRSARPELHQLEWSGRPSS